MRRLELIVLGCLLACCITAHAADRSDDAAKLLGTWKIVSVNGQSDTSNVEWVVEGDRYTIRMDGKSMETWTIKLDANQKRIDAFHHDTPRGTFGGKLKGIYEIKGDSLKVCYDATGQRYPKSMGAGSGEILYQLQRQRR